MPREVECPLRNLPLPFSMNLKIIEGVRLLDFRRRSFICSTGFEAAYSARCCVSDTHEAG